MPKIKIFPSKDEFEYKVGKSLLTILLENGVYVDNPCNGNGTCKKCKVKIINGDKSKIREACLVVPNCDMEIELISFETKSNILEEGYMPFFEFDKKVDKGVCGLAVDIGTTTIVAALVDLKTGKELSLSSMINPQTVYGYDVLTRISHVIEHKEKGIRDLQIAIVSSLNSMIEEVCKGAEIDRTDICEITVSANTTMIHTLLGLDIISIGKSPYKPLFTGSKRVMARELGINVNTNAYVYCLPIVSAFIGGDIVSGAYVCNLINLNSKVLFIDIGTNGEMVFSNNGKLMCCSCAAGPALEGMNISYGMRASLGAIEKIQITPEGVKYDTIGSELPKGICGSGILSALKELIKNGLIKPNGTFIKKEELQENDYRYGMIGLDGKKREFIITDLPQKIVITQNDIRQIQLAKGAILSGFISLLDHEGVKTEELDKIIIAGQFGAHLDVDSLIVTGILPKDVREKIEYVGNTSKTGAYMTLMSDKIKCEAEKLAGKMNYLELADLDGYERLFAQSLNF